MGSLQGTRHLRNGQSYFLLGPIAVLIEPLYIRHFFWIIVWILLVFAFPVVGKTVQILQFFDYESIYLHTFSFCSRLRSQSRPPRALNLAMSSIGSLIDRVSIGSLLPRINRGRPGIRLMTSITCSH